MNNFICGVAFFAVAISTILCADTTVTSEVFFDVTIAGESVGRIVIGLFGETAPRTVKNFEILADGKEGYGFENTKFHRAIKDFMIQGGDITTGDGTGGKSIYGDFFDDEDFTLLHYGAGWVSMANRGPDTNSSHFFITTIVTPWLDGRHVVFGKVVRGMEVVKLLENVETNAYDTPIDPCLIVKSGVLEVDTPYEVSKDEVVVA